MAEPINCRFDEASHTYYMDDVPVPSVTQALVESGIINTEFFNDWGRWRGSTVHKITQLYDENDLVEDSVDPDLVGYLDAWKKFKREFAFDIRGIEVELYHSTAKYGGCLDRVGIVAQGGGGILDIKTGPLTRAVGLQLTGYADAYESHTGIAVNHLYGVQIKEDGTYKMKTYGLEFVAWRAALTVCHWRRGK